MRILDVSVRMAPGMPVWPSMPEVQTKLIRSFVEGDGVNVTHYAADVHVGTHVDAPLHFVDGGAPVDEMSLAATIGDCLVVELGGAQITAADLEAARIPAGTKRLLLRTRNSAPTVDRSRFNKGFVALTPDASQWIADRGIALVGVDGASVQRFHDPDPATHVILLSRGIVIVEGLDLRDVTPGPYVLICLPIKIAGAEGAPARTILLDGPLGLFG